MLVAAEASGDALGAGLAAAIRRMEPSVRFVGLGGARMAAEGVQSPFDYSELSVLGFAEGIAAYPRVRRRVAEMAALAAREKPDIAVLIDSWGFTYRVARALRAASPALPLVKYVGPQVWASRPKRAKTLAKTFDHLLSILPFDAPFYAHLNFPVTFVGNPSLATDFSQADARRLRSAIGAAPDDQILLVLPGSRPSEITRVMPPFEDAVNLLKADRPNLHIVLPVAASVAGMVKARVAGWPHRAHVVETEQAKRDAMKAATVALACSGTVTTELALAGAPMVVGYRLGAVTHALIKRLIRTPWVVLFNIAAKKFVAPEMIQDNCNGPALAREVALRLDDPDLRARQIAEQDAALLVMGRGEPDPAEKAAEVVVGMLKSRT